jgi:DNA-binding response OmpR family regulator
VSRRVLIVEPDASGRAMMDRVLTGGGYAPDTVGSVLDAGAMLDAGQVEVVVIDELAGSRPALEQVRWLVRKYPTVPVIVTGALLSRHTMQELVRMRVVDVLAKPFTPGELRDAVGRAIEQNAVHHVEALEYSAALTDARRAIAAGRYQHASAPLARAHATSPLDSEIMALYALIAELDGKDQAADRGFRAALALRDEEASAPPDPHEALARLAAYQGARPTTALGALRARQPFWIVTDAAEELRAPAPVDGPLVVVMSLGLSAEDDAAIYLRDGEGDRAFLLMSGPLRPEPIAALLRVLDAGEVVAAAPTVARLDLARIAALRETPTSAAPERAASASPASR